MPANPIVLGPCARDFAKGPPQKGPHYGLAALGFLWITLDERDMSFVPDFWGFRAIFLSFWTSLDALERYWMVGRVATASPAQVADLSSKKISTSTRCP